MKRIYFFIITIIIGLDVLAQAPTYAWAKSAGGGNSESGRGVATDAIGNVYVTGNFYSSTLVFGSTTLTCSGIDDMYIVKYDSNGNVIWAKSAGGTNIDRGYGVATDANGNIFVTGFFSSSAIIFGSTTLTPVSGEDIFIVKYDPSGNVLWAKNEGGSNNEFGSAVATDLIGNCYVTGYFGSSTMTIGSTTLTNAGGGDKFIVKYNPSGNVLWAKSAGGTALDAGYGVTTDAGGNVFVTGGYVSSTIAFGTTTLTNSNAGTYDMYIVKYDGNGNVLWAKREGGTNNEEGNSATSDLNGNVYVIGYFGSPTIAIGSTTLTNGGGSDVLIVKYDANGNVLWTKSAGGINTDVGHGVSTDPNGNVYAIGRFSSSSITFSSTTLTNAGNYDICIVKYDANGNFIWAKAEGGASDDRGNGIATYTTGNVYGTGYFNSPTISFGSTTLTNVAASDVFLAKLNNCSGAPVQPGSISGPLTICNGSAGTYSVGQVSGTTSYTWSLPSGWSGTSTSNTISTTSGSSGNITVAASNACGTSSVQTLSVTVNPLPTITVNSGSICSGSSFTISLGGASTYTIQGGSAVVSPTANTSYSVTGTSSAGCTSSALAISNVTVNPLPTISVSSSTNQLCIGSAATLSATGASSYTWNPSGTGSSIVISPTVNTTYTITGTDANGCQNTTTITQNVMNCGGMSVLELNNSHVISVFPNPTNGILLIKYDADKFEIKVYNVIGELVSLAFGEHGKSEVDLSSQSAGIYFIKVGSVTKKVIKK
jgi:hypothetical protein